MGYPNIGMSQLSTQYYCVPVAARTSGTSYNPTADTVQFAFMPQATQVPTSGNWVSGSWETVPTNLLYPYSARCLIGPSGTTALTTGVYEVYLKVSDSPEVPVLITGYLEIS